MTLAAGDLTTPERVSTWFASAPTLPSDIISQLITSMTAMIYAKLNRSRTFSQNFTRIFDGVGNMQLVLPDYPVTAVSLLQIGQRVIQRSVLVPQGTPQPANTTPGYGYRFIPWNGVLPGEPNVVEFAGGYFWTGAQNIQVAYTAGYLISAEAWTIAVAPGPYTITVAQPQGIWCRDNGVTYADGTPLVPVATITAKGQYIPPLDAAPGLYTFGSADAGEAILVSYSFIPADLEEACIQMVAERYAYRNRIGELAKTLGGQETIRFVRGGLGPPWSRTSSLPPEVMDLIQPYVSVLPPLIGAPV